MLRLIIHNIIHLLHQKNQKQLFLKDQIVKLMLTLRTKKVK